LKEAKANLKEYGIRGKNNSNLKNKRRIFEEVNKIIKEELGLLNGYNNYDLEKYFDRRLVYASSFLVFFNTEDSGLAPATENPDEDFYFNNYSGTVKDENIIRVASSKLLNLVAGYELLGLGLNVHGTAEDIIKNEPSAGYIPGEDIDRNYTLELLFGDIIYSRAVVYIIKYRDFNVFEDILRSLIALHCSRIDMHRKLSLPGSLSPDKILPGQAFDNIPGVKNLNSLLKSSFLTGLGASNFQFERNGLTAILRIIENIVLLKTCSDIENGMIKAQDIISKMDRSGYLSLAGCSRENIRKKIDCDIKLVTPDWLRNNFLDLIELFY
jgi:hypothetical protein